MSPTTAELWKLAVDSRLLSADDCRRLDAAFAQSGVNGEATAQSLADWLIRQQAITRYQAKVLLARRPGPFLYGDYKVQERLDGRLSGLFRAVHVPTGQRVLLHFLAGPDAQDAARWEAVGQRSAAATKLVHPHLARAFQLVDLGTYKFVVLADLAGGSLDELLAAQHEKPLPPTEACRIVRQAAAGLAALYATGSVHGDLRPANIWLDADKNVKLLGFPLVAEPAAATEMPSDRLSAAADYLAPEASASSRPPDARADVYALGCVLYQLLAGRPPYAGGDVAEKARRHAAGAPEALERLNPAVPKSLAQVVAFTMAKNPAERYANAAALVDALSPFVPVSAAASAAMPPTREAEAYEAWLRRSGAAVSKPVAAAVAPTATAAPVAARAAPAAASAIPTAQAAIPMAQPVASAIAAPPAGALPVAQPIAPGVGGIAVASALAVPELAAISVAASGPSIGRQRTVQRKRGRSKLGFALAAIGAVAALGIGGFFFWPQIESLVSTPMPAPHAVAPPAGRPAATNGAAPKPVDTVAANVKPAIPPDAEIITALDEDVWQSPTKGTPLDLSYLPAGTQMFVALRPADILAHEEGPRVLAALGPFGEFAWQQLAALAGTPPENVEQAVFGLLAPPRDEDPPLVALVVRAKEAVAEEDLVQAWGGPSEESVAGQRVWQNTTATYYVPSDGGGKLWALAPLSTPEDVETWLAGAKKPPSMQLAVEALARSSDAQRHLTVLFSPNALKPGLFPGPAARIRTPLLDFLSVSSAGEQPQAALFGLHLKDDDFFAEVRAYGPATVQPVELAMRYRDAVNGLEKRYLRYLQKLNPHEYGADFLSVDFAPMLDLLADYTRVGVDGKQAVLRCYLPSVAAHNLALGTQLAAMETPGSGGGATAVAATPPPAAKTAAEKLQERATFVSPRGPFDKFAETIGDELGIRVVLVGKDFEAEGITKNQQFDMNEQDKTYAEILKVALLKANPAGKLVFVIRQEEGAEVIAIVTRKGVEKRNETIHEVFAAP